MLAGEQLGAGSLDCIRNVLLDHAATGVDAGPLVLDRDEGRDQVIRKWSHEVADIGDRARRLRSPQRCRDARHDLILAPAVRFEARYGFGSSAHSRNVLRLEAIKRPTWTWLVPTRSAICA